MLMLTPEINTVYASFYPEDWTFRILSIHGEILGCEWISGPKELPCEFSQTIERFHLTTKTD